MISWELLIGALIVVESNGKLDAVGDNGKAFGPLQIHQCVVDDVNQAYGTTYTHSDCFDLEKSKTICRLYLTKWGVRRGMCQLSQLARIWNGGPHGYANPATIPYWERVNASLHQLAFEDGTYDVNYIDYDAENGAQFPIEWEHLCLSFKARETADA